MSEGQVSEFAAAVKTGQRSSQNFKTAWHTYCESNNQTFFDPSRHEQSFLQNFFDQVGLGYIQMSREGSSMSTTPGMGNMGGPNNVNANGINPMSNVNPMGGNPMVGGQNAGGGGGKINIGVNMGGGYGGNAKGGGGGYRGNQGQSGPYARTDTKGGSTSRAGKGGVINASPNSPLKRIQELVKMGQRSSPEWKQLWIEWCSTHGNGVQDPARHSSLFILSFVLRFGLAPVVGSTWAEDYLVSLGELAKPYMTSTISQGCKQSDSWNELWCNFADGKGAELRDPTKHDAGSLMEFFDMTAMVQFANEQWMLCYQTGNEDMHARGGMY